MNNITIVIANSNFIEGERLKAVVAREYNAILITKPVPMKYLVERCQAVIVDSNFTGKDGLDFIRALVANSYIPVLIITPLDRQIEAIQAIRAGAYNYVVKTRGYEEACIPAISQALFKFEERDEMRETIVRLRQEVDVLNQRIHELTVPDKAAQRTSEPVQTEAAQSVQLIDEINEMLHRGEVNLPVYPELDITLAGMIRKCSPINEIAIFLKKDASITSKLIGVANSAYYRGANDIRTLDDAINRLGLLTTKNYVSVITNRSMYVTRDPEYQTMLRDLWQHSLACAHASFILAETLKLESPEQVFTMGLLHDIGRLLLVQIISEIKIRNPSLYHQHAGEIRELICHQHARFGGALLKRWKLPEEFEMVASYHNDIESTDPLSRPLCVVNLADQLVNQLGYGTREGQSDLSESIAARLLMLDSGLITSVAARVTRIMNNVSDPAAIQ
jgi:HD-like signal output (HDOD) protein/CheY-like chemotaxis protein